MRESWGVTEYALHYSIFVQNKTKQNSTVYMYLQVPVKKGLVSSKKGCRILVRGWY